MRFFLPFISSWLGRQEQVQSEPPEPCTPPDICYSPPELWEIEFEHDPNMRTQSLCQPCKTVAYPSAGGIVLGFFSAVELIYLNISRTETTKRSTDPAEEDDLATRMLKLGAYWWPSWEVYARHQAQINDNITYDYLFPPVLNVGYPQMSSGGGVWVLKFSADQQTWDPEDMRKPYLERMPEDWPSSMDLVMTMDERCAVLKRFGATFYEKVEDCPDIAQSLPEAIQRGMRYAELLSKMNDVHYMCIRDDLTHFTACLDVSQVPNGRGQDDEGSRDGKAEDGGLGDGWMDKDHDQGIVAKPWINPLIGSEKLYSWAN